MNGCTPTEHLLVTAALAPDATRARAAWEAWISAGEDLQTTGPRALAAMPVVGANLARFGVGVAESERLAGLRRFGFVQYAVRRRVAVEIAQILSVHRIDVALAGVDAVAMAIGAEPGLWAGDAPVLLVRPREVQQAVRVLRAAGWLPSGKFAPTLVPALTGDADLASMGVVRKLAWHRERDATSFQLQWSWLACQAGPDSDTRLWRSAGAPGNSAGPCWTPARPDVLLALLVDIGSRSDAGPRSLIDAVLLARACTLDDFATLVEEAIDRGLAHPVATALRMLVPWVQQTSTPSLDGFIARLNAMPDAYRLRTSGGIVDDLRPHVHRRPPLEAALVAGRGLIHRAAASPSVQRFRPVLRPVWRLLRPWVLPRPKA